MKFLRTNAAVRLLRNFVVSSDTAGTRKKEILRYLTIMEDAFLAIDVAGRKKQSAFKKTGKNVESVLEICFLIVSALHLQFTVLNE